MTLNENFWVTDLDKVVSIKCSYEQNFYKYLFCKTKNIVKIVRGLPDKAGWSKPPLVLTSGFNWLKLPWSLLIRVVDWKFQVVVCVCLVDCQIYIWSGFKIRLPRVLIRWLHGYCNESGSFWPGSFQPIFGVGRFGQFSG